MRLWKILAPLAIGLAVGCATTKPATLAGSTSALRMLRDWRGTWTGTMEDSPMGKMPYTLYVEDVGGTGLLRVRMARPTDPLLETVSQTYEFLEFKEGTPKIRFSVSQRNSTQEGTLLYDVQRSSDREAVFCLAGRGCDKLMAVFTVLGPQDLEMRTLVNEASHSRALVAYTSPDVPTETAPAATPATFPEPSPEPKKKEKKPVDDGPIDRDAILEENYDKDITHEHLDEDIRAP